MTADLVHILKQYGFLLVALLAAGAAWLSCFGNPVCGFMAVLATIKMHHASGYSCTDLFSKKDQYINFIKNDMRLCLASQRRTFKI